MNHCLTPAFEGINQDPEGGRQSRTNLSALGHESLILSYVFYSKNRLNRALLSGPAGDSLVVTFYPWK